MDNEKAVILLVDDDAVDVRAIKRAFKEARISNPIVVAENGVDALAVLRGEDPERVIGRPYMILLDVNMPKMNGLEFLDVIRADKELSDSVVFMLTTSNDDKDKFAAYQRHVSGYLLKSRAADDFLEHAKMIKQFLFSIELPPAHPIG